MFTRNFGLILAQVQSIRNLKSKLRYSLQDLSYSNIDLVRGKGGWRIISARNKENIFHILNTSEHIVAMTMLSRIVILLRRLVKGEEENQQLFSDIMSLYDVLKG